MKTLPKWDEIEKVVVYPIENGITVVISTFFGVENHYAFRSYRLVLKFLKQIKEENIGIEI